MLSRGTPMMLAGDEFRNSQGGNNNVYCQDNPTSWLNWENLEEHHDVWDFAHAMIDLRCSHPIISRHDYDHSPNETGYPEMSFHGAKAWELNMQEPFHTFGFMYAEPASMYGGSRDAFIYCGVNAYWEPRTLELPILPKDHTWHV